MPAATAACGLGGGALDPSSGIKLKVLREGLPVIMNRQLHHKLISQTFSEQMDFKISISRLISS